MYIFGNNMFNEPSEITLMWSGWDVFTSTLLKMIDLGCLFANLLPITHVDKQTNVCVIFG